MKRLFLCALFGVGLAMGVWVDRLWISRGGGTGNPSSDSASDKPGAGAAGPDRPSRQIQYSPGAVRTRSAVDEATIEARLRAILAEGDHSRRWERLQGFALELLASDIPVAMAVADRVLPKSMRSGFSHQLLGRWAESDPQGALAYAEAIPNRDERQNMLFQVLGGWARVDAEGALAHVEGWPPGNLKYQSLHAILGPLAAQDPERAIRVAEGAPPSHRISLYQSIASTWVGNDPAGAAAWAQGLPSAMQHQGILRAIASRWAENDSDAAMAWLRSLPESRVKRDAMTGITWQLADEDPRRAMGTT